ncbi:MAG: hypothetical protein B7Z15_23505 [Rhizobiales bacterium 32-66-8]|nr:MAG: hypothetical protein B7Z15_23505 [Rhizobiales bacterium 32-66-8]
MCARRIGSALRWSSPQVSVTPTRAAPAVSAGASSLPLPTPQRGTPATRSISRPVSPTALPSRAPIFPPTRPSPTISASISSTASTGCYVGQEVVSRMKHRGTARRRPVIVTGLAAPAGSAVLAGSREAGTIGQVVDGRAVAILRLDRITDAAAITVDGKPVTVTLPVWATYKFGDTVPED